MVILHASFHTLFGRKGPCALGLGWGRGWVGLHTSQGSLQSWTLPETPPESTGRSPQVRSEKHQRPTRCQQGEASWKKVVWASQGIY